MEYEGMGAAAGLGEGVTVEGGDGGGWKKSIIIIHAWSVCGQTRHRRIVGRTDARREERCGGLLREESGQRAGRRVHHLQPALESFVELSRGRHAAWGPSAYIYIM